MENTPELPPSSESAESGELRVSFASLPSERPGSTGCEDELLADTENGVFAVFDGIGGHAAGEAASRLAAAVVRESLKGEPTANSVESAILQANKAVLDKSKESPELRGMGTTASVIKIRTGPEGRREALIGNVGDSRIYLWRGRELRPLTLDDNLYLALANKSPEEAFKLQAALDRITSEADAKKLGFTDRKHYYSQTGTITQALGTERTQIKPHTARVELEPGDRLLITSDGIHDNLTAAEMLGILSASPKAEALMRAAQTRSRQEDHIRHKLDDMTAVLVEIPS